MLPQPASDRTTSTRNSLKQGVVRVPNIKEMVILPSGEIKPLKALTSDELKPLAKKVNDGITRLAYDLVMKDLEHAQKAAN